MNVNYAELTWPDIQQAIKDDVIAVLPLGCIEQHGPHLPLDCDAASPVAAVGRAHREQGTRALVLPVLPYGPAWEHMGFPGTISLSYETWLRVVREIVASLLHHGFRRIVILPGCGGHFGVEAAVYRLWGEERRKGRDVVLEVAPIIAGLPQVQQVVQRLFPDIADVHAGEFETSITLAFRPHLVAKDRIPQTQTQRPPHGCWWARIEEISSNGATGDPSRASEQAGRDISEAMERALAEWVSEFDHRTKQRGDTGHETQPQH